MGEVIECSAVGGARIAATGHGVKSWAAVAGIGANRDARKRFSARSTKRSCSLWRSGGTA